MPQAVAKSCAILQTLRMAHQDLVELLQHRQVLRKQGCWGDDDGTVQAPCRRVHAGVDRREVAQTGEGLARLRAGIQEVFCRNPGKYRRGGMRAKACQVCPEGLGQYLAQSTHKVAAIDNVVTRGYALTFSRL